MKIVVTGGSGFIGSHLVKSLKKEGHSIVVIDKNAKQLETPRFKSYRCDIRNVKETHQILKKVEPDIIIHLAGKHNLIESSTKPDFYIKNNISGTINILEYVKTSGKRVKFMLASSAGSIYTKGKMPFTESTSPMPNSLYGITKDFEEKLVKHYCGITGNIFQILRISNVYGPGQEAYKHPSVVPSMIRNLILKKRVVIYGNGSQTRDFIYIDDVVEAFMRIIRTNRSLTINVSSMIEISIKELYELLDSKLSKQKAAPSVVYMNLEKGVKRSWVSNKKIIKEFNWKPLISFNDGLDRTITHMRRVLNKR